MGKWTQCASLKSSNKGLEIADSASWPHGLVLLEAQDYRAEDPLAHKRPVLLPPELAMCEKSFMALFSR